MDVWQKRKELGDGYKLVQELRLNAPLFFTYTRMNHARFEFLLNLVAPYLKKRDISTAIPPEQRLAMTLRFLATGDNMTSMAFAYRCGFATANVIIRETLAVLIHVLRGLVVTEPQSKEAWKSIAVSYYTQWNLPHCLGAIDGKHMVIEAPPKSGSTFRNYKGTFSINLMAVADADYTFITADVGAEGSQNDSGVLNNTSFWKRVRQGDMHIPEAELLPESGTEMNYFFVGDGIFQLQKHLMKPFGARKLSLREAVYNYRLSRARRVVENAFGILAARWQLFRAPMRCSLETAEKIVPATLCLHNFIMRSRDHEARTEYNPSQFVDVEASDGSLIPGRWRTMVVEEGRALRPLPLVARGCARNAIQMRQQLVECVNNEGAVPWQIEKVRKGFWGAYIVAEIPEVTRLCRRN